MNEKMIEKKRTVFLFHDFQYSYDKISKEALWQLLKINGVFKGFWME